MEVLDILAKGESLSIIADAIEEFEGATSRNVVTLRLLAKVAESVDNDAVFHSGIMDIVAMAISIVTIALTCEKEPALAVFNKYYIDIVKELMDLSWLGKPKPINGRGEEILQEILQEMGVEVTNG